MTRRAKARDADVEEERCCVFVERAMIRAAYWLLTAAIDDMRRRYVGDDIAQEAKCFCRWKYDMLSSRWLSLWGSRSRDLMSRRGVAENDNFAILVLSLYLPDAFAIIRRRVYRFVGLAAGAFSARRLWRGLMTTAFPRLMHAERGYSPRGFGDSVYCEALTMLSAVCASLNFYAAVVASFLSKSAFIFA